MIRMSRRAASSDFGSLHQGTRAGRTLRARVLLRQVGALLLVGAAAYVATQPGGHRFAEKALADAGGVAAGVGDAVRTAAAAFYERIPIR